MNRWMLTFPATIGINQLYCKVYESNKDINPDNFQNFPEKIFSTVTIEQYLIDRLYYTIHIYKAAKLLLLQKITSKK